jgi:outer membrane immunogenic protein
MTNKSLLTAAILGAVTAAISSAAFADNSMTSTYCKPGFYAGLQGGRSDTFYNAYSALGPVAYNNNGSTVSTTSAGGVVTGQTTTSYSTAVSATHMDNIGIGGRVYAGYQFNPYFAMETGYTQYAKTTFGGTARTSQTSVTNYPAGIAPTGIPQSGVTKYYGEITEHAIDMVAKATMPLQSGFGLYAKAGMAYIAADKHVNANSSGTTITNVNNGTTTTVTNGVSAYGTTYTKSYQGFRPVAGAGISFTVPNTNITLDASYTRVFSYGAIPNASLAAFGAEYKFA